MIAAPGRATVYGGVPMSPLIVAAGVAVFAGGLLQSATGIGFALVAGPLLFAALGPQEAIGTLLALGTVVGTLILATESRRPRPLARDGAVMLAWSPPGALLGVAVLRSLDEVALQLAVTGGVALTLVARHWAARRGAAPRPRPAWSAPLAGFAAGTLSTTTNMSGPPLLLHLMGRGDEPVRVRDTITVCFLGLTVISVAALWVTGTSGAVPDAAVLAGLVPAAALGALFGRLVFARLVSADRYEQVLTGVLLVSVTTALAVTLL
jgi:uncharacterized membrane protein YfcA